MLQDQKNSKKQGDVGHGIAIGWFASQGHTVCIPLTDSQDYDLIIDIDDKLYKVQVKTTTFKTKYGIYNVSLTVNGGNRSGKGKIKKFDNTKVDYLFILTNSGIKYLIPTSEFTNVNSLCLGTKYQKYIID